MKIVITLLIYILSTVCLHSEHFKEFDEIVVKDNYAFYWDKFIMPGENFDNPDEIIDLPFDWSRNPKYGVWGKGTFKTNIVIPDYISNLTLLMKYNLDSYVVYVNGALVAKNYSHNGKRRLSNVIVPLEKSSEIEMVIHIENYDDNHGGLGIPPVLGEFSVLNRKLNKSIIFDSFLFGVLILAGLLYCSFYLSKKNEKSALYFGLFSLILGFRTILYGEHILLMIFTNLPLELEATLGHLTFYIAIPIFLKFFSSSFPFRYHKIFLRITYIISGIYSTFAIVFPHRILIELLLPFQLFCLFIAGLATFILVRRTLHGNYRATATLMGFSVMFYTTVNDILLAQEVVHTFHMTPLGMLFFIISQGIILSLNIAKSLKKSENLANELTHVNKSFKRFVPEEFLNILHKRNISEIRLGDHVQLNMTIMFCDIRDFTNLSEKMTPRENFLFINSFLERIGPVIRKHGGFIDKYMGDGIMSLFPESADTAVNAALDILKTLEIYNTHRASSDYDKIRLGIGINTGSIMLGTIGENERMDGTVISDAVNICSRIESITKEYGLSIAISEDTYNNIYNKEHFKVRNIGKITLKGKDKPVSVYELFNSDPDRESNLKISLKEDFEHAIDVYESGNNIKAEVLFSKIIDIFPDDRACNRYLQKIRDPEGKRGFFHLY